MRLAFLELPLAERSLYFQQAALQRGLHPVIMEKDWLSGISRSEKLLYYQ